MPTLKVNEIISYSGNTLSLGTSGDTVTVPANVTFNALSGNVYIPNGIIKLDSITTSATATYNLTYGGSAYSPASATACLVSVNGVLQTPGTAFTISGSQITFSSALNPTDVINFIIVLAAPYTINAPGDGTVGFNQITSNLITGATAETSIAGGDSVLIYDDSASALRKMTRTNFIGGGNTPAFFATMSADQSGVADSTFTKVQFNSERFDTNSAYDPTTNYRFTVPSGQGGKYFFSSILIISDAGAQNIDACDYAFYINGAQNLYSSYILVSSETALNVSVNGFFNLSAGDYVEMFIYADITSGGTFNINQDTTTKARCFWYGYKIIE
jgi:hypothetical protein